MTFANITLDDQVAGVDAVPENGQHMTANSPVQPDSSTQL